MKSVQNPPENLVVFHQLTPGFGGGILLKKAQKQLRIDNCNVGNAWMRIATGSDATAAGGGLRELSEWQRSIKSRKA